MRKRPLDKKTLQTRTYQKDKVFVNYLPEAPNRNIKRDYSHFILFMGERSVLIKIFEKTTSGKLETGIILEDGEREKAYYEAVKRLPNSAVLKFKNCWNGAKLQLLKARQEANGKKPTLLLGPTIVDAVRKNGELVEIKSDVPEFVKENDGDGFIAGKYAREYKVAPNVKVHLQKKEKENIDLGIFNYRNPNSLLVDKFTAAGDVNFTELANKLGFANTSMISKHLAGERDITREQAIKYASYFGCDPADILFPKPMVKIWGHVDFINGIEHDYSYAPGEIAAQAEEILVECPRDIYRPDIRAVKVVCPGSYLHDQVLFYYESNDIDANVGQLCVAGLNTEIEDFNFQSRSYHIGIYENVRGKIRFANPDPYSDGKDVVVTKNSELFFTSPIVGMVNLKSMMTSNPKSSALFKKAAQVQAILREQEEKAQKEQHLKMLKYKGQLDKLRNEIEKFNNILQDNKRLAAKEMFKAEEKRGPFDDIFEDVKFENDLQDLREAKKRA